jgi:hypothetical protein
MSVEKYYSTDLYIAIKEIKADSKEQAEAIMREFTDKIALIMKEEIRWEESEWNIEENVLNEAEGVWEVSN